VNALRCDSSCESVSWQVSCCSQVGDTAPDLDDARLCGCDCLVSVSVTECISECVGVIVHASLCHGRYRVGGLALP